MKFLLIFLFVMGSCNNQRTKENLEGNWTLCKIENNGVILNLNVCPQIEFTEGGQNKIIMPSKDEIKFTYSLDSYNNIIELSFEKPQPYFESGIYYLKHEIHNEEELLLLSSKDELQNYIFSKKM